jgi:predicted unusual protein kinase regulating ubiquinone biosynthesis (AarF/ABC1/UbiB family)
LPASFSSSATSALCAAITAAPIGQVHRAVLPDGRVLAVKVQYPGVRASIDADVDNLATLLRLSHLLPPTLDLAPLLAEAKRQLADEADYLREGAQMRAYGERLSDDARYVVPALRDDLTTTDVLTMEFVEGRPIEALADAPQDVRDRAMTMLIELVLRELFEFA